MHSPRNHTTHFRMIHTSQTNSKQLKSSGENVLTYHRKTKYRNVRFLFIYSFFVYICFYFLQYCTALALRKWVRSSRMPTHTRWKCGQSLKSLIYGKGPALNCTTKLCQWLKNSSWVLPCLTDTLTLSNTLPRSRRLLQQFPEGQALLTEAVDPLPVCFCVCVCDWRLTTPSAT